MTEIPDKSWFKIGEVSRIVGVKPYVIRYWESEFREVRPSRTRSGQRLFRPGDIRLLLVIQTLLHEQRFTIDGARQHLKDLADAEISWDDALVRLRAGSLVAGADVEPSGATHPIEDGGARASIDAEAATRIHDLETELKRLEGRVRAATQALHAERDVLKGRIEQAEGRAAAARADAERAESMVRALRDEREAGQAHADATMAAERDRLRDQVDALLTQRDTASAECDDLKAQLDAALDAARALRVAHERTESGRAALEVEASDLRSRMRELQDLCDERQAEASRAEARLGALEAELAGAGTVRDAYRLAVADQAARWRALIARVDE